MPDYYPSMPTGDDSAPSEPDDTSANTSSEEPNQEDMDANSALLPKSILGGKDYKPGDEITLKIVHLYDDECEVQMVGNKKKEGGNSYLDEALGKMGSKQEEMA